MASEAQPNTPAYFIEEARKRGNPTNDEFAESFWRWSNSQSVSYQLAAQTMREAGYKPFPGFPLQRLRASTPQTQPLQVHESEVDIPSHITDPVDDRKCDPLYGQRMDDADLGRNEFTHAISNSLFHKGGLTPVATQTFPRVSTREVLQSHLGWRGRIQ